VLRAASSVAARIGGARCDVMAVRNTGSAKKNDGRSQDGEGGVVSSILEAYSHVCHEYSSHPLWAERGGASFLILAWTYRVVLVFLSCLVCSTLVVGPPSPHFQYRLATNVLAADRESAHNSGIDLWFVREQHPSNNARDVPHHREYRESMAVRGSAHSTPTRSSQSREACVSGAPQVHF
jgi:hypothetical protein